MLSKDAPEKELVVDCNDGAFVPHGYKKGEHKTSENFVWSPGCVEFFPMIELLQAKEWDQKSPSILYDELALNPVCNIGVMEFFKKNPHHIPQECSGKWLFFLGTTFTRSTDSDRYICYLLKKSGIWGHDTIWWCGIPHHHYYVALHKK